MKWGAFVLDSKSVPHAHERGPQGGVEANMQQTIPNFQGSPWTCKPRVGAWQGRYARAFAAQLWPHNSATAHFFSVEEQMSSLIVWVWALEGGV
eukprot:387588-Pelagomonas_calceolata.AAC.7